MLCVTLGFERGTGGESAAAWLPWLVFKLSFASNGVWGGCGAVLGGERHPGAFTPWYPSCPLSELFGNRSCLMDEHGSGLTDGQHGPQLS